MSKDLPSPDVLRRNIIEKLERLPDVRIAEVYDFLLKMEMERLVDEIRDEAEEVDLSPQAIEFVKEEHRRRHPYGQ